MHALVARAIAAAANDGVPRFSHAALPAPCPPGRARPRRWACQTREAAASAAGLRRFKTAFAPRFEPLYAAARGRSVLALGALDLAREITRPPPTDGS